MKELVSLELECPHVVCALKMYSWLSPGLETPHVYPLFGITATKLMAIARDLGESPRLAVCAWNVLDIGWTILPCVSSRIVKLLERHGCLYGI